MIVCMDKEFDGVLHDARIDFDLDVELMPCPYYGSTPEVTYKQLPYGNYWAIGADPLGGARQADRWHMSDVGTTIRYSHRADVPRHKVADEVIEFVRRAYGVEGEPELPHAEKVVFSGPATVMLWPDGTKTVTKCREGDSLDYVFGMLACILRKLTRNRGHAVEENEAALKEMASKIDSMEDLDELLDYVSLMHDTLTVLRESSVLWVDQLGDPEPEPEPEPARPSDEELSRQAELMRQIAFMTKEMERICAQPIDFGGDGDE